MGEEVEEEKEEEEEEEEEGEEEEEEEEREEEEEEKSMCSMMGRWRDRQTDIHTFSKGAMHMQSWLLC